MTHPELLAPWYDLTVRPSATPEITPHPDGTFEISATPDGQSRVTLLLRPDELRSLIEQGNDLLLLGKVPE